MSHNHRSCALRSEGPCWIPAVSAYSRRVSRLDRITSDPKVCHGKPVISRLGLLVTALEPVGVGELGHDSGEVFEEPEL